MMMVGSPVTISLCWLVERADTVYVDDDGMSDDDDNGEHGLDGVMVAF